MQKPFLRVLQYYTNVTALWNILNIFRGSWIEMKKGPFFILLEALHIFDKIVAVLQGLIFIFWRSTIKASGSVRGGFSEIFWGEKLPSGHIK